MEPTLADPNATQPKTTTDEVALKTEGQRAINRIWETSQSRIAGATVATYLMGCTVILFAVVWQMSVGTKIDERMMGLAITSFVSLASTVSAVIGFYFGRTNHQREGGVGQGETGR